MKYASRMESVVKETLAAWEIPGAALAVHAEGESYSVGFGLAEAGTVRKTGADTVFALGSTTKAFTSLAVGMLVDEGKVAWDDPIKKHLPWFRLEDSWVSDHATIRDALCHRLGLERAQRIYYHGGYTQRQLIERMRYLKPERGFRESFVYANQNYGLAGLVIEAASGMSWDTFITDRIFNPLGMTRTGSGWDVVAGWPDLASPHAVAEGTLPAGVRMFGQKKPVPRFNLSHEPAGSIHSSASDMARWVAFLSAGGTPLVEAATFAEILAPQNIMRELGQSELAPMWYLKPLTNFWTYALGWWALDYRGFKVLIHGGQMPGFNSIVAFLPALESGFAVMLNTHQTLGHAAVFFAIADMIIDGEPSRDWNSQFLEVARGYVEEVVTSEEKAKSTLPDDKSPDKTLSAYTGTFTNELYGNVLVTESNGRLELQYGLQGSFLESLGGKRWMVHWNYAGILEDCTISYGDDEVSIFLERDRAIYKRT